MAERRYPRLPFVGQVKVTYGKNGPEMYFAADFAPGGIFVTAEKLAPLGASARVGLEPIGQPPLPDLDATVAHVEDGGTGKPRGIGLRFRNVGAKQSAALHEIYTSLGGEAAPPPEPARRAPTPVRPPPKQDEDAFAKTSMSPGGLLSPPTPAEAAPTPAPPTPPATAQSIGPGSVLDGRYRLEEQIGEGGMGRVFRAEQVFMKRKVAVKLLGRALADEPEMAARFQREAQLVSQLDHPNIVRVFDFGKSPEGLLFLVMELVEGEPLSQIIAREKRMQPARAVTMLAQICEALGEAHGLGIIHRDLKPENVIVVKKGGAEVPKVLDFGIARTMERDSVTNLTQTGIVIGTPKYLSPEQAMALPLDARADIYSVGVIAFELLSGRVPFEGRSAMEVVTKHIHEAAPALEKIVPELKAALALCAVVRSALEKEPHKRPGSANELSSLLRAAIAAPPVAVAVPVPVPVAVPPPGPAPVLGVDVDLAEPEPAVRKESAQSLALAEWASDTMSAPPAAPAPSAVAVVAKTGGPAPCATCGTSPHPGDRFCPGCGAPVPGPCPRCGADYVAGTRFCPSCGAGLAATPAPTTPPPAGLPRFVIPPPLAGRKKLLTALLRHAGDGTGSALRPVLILGEAGSGKTALVDELASSLGPRGWTKLVISQAGPARFAALRAVAANLEGARHSASGAISRLEMGILARLSRGARIPETTTIPMLAQALLAAMKGVGLALVVFDDLDASDAGTRAVFEALCVRPLPRPGILLVGLARSRTAVQTALKPAALEPLAREEGAALVSGLLATERPAGPITAALLELGGGAPQRIIDAAHLLAERGLLRRTQGGWALSSLPNGLPTDAEGLVDTWFSALPTVLRRALYLAALGSPTFSPRLLGAALEADPVPVFEALAVRNLLRKVGEGRWTFTRPLYRTSAERLATPSEQQALAAALAAALEADRTEGEHAARAGALPRILARAGDSARCMRAYERSALAALKAEDESLAAQLLAEEVEWLEPLLETGKIPAAEAEPVLALALTRLAALRLASGEMERAHAALGGALALRKKMSDLRITAEMLACSGRFDRKSGRVREAEATLREASNLLRDNPDPAVTCLIAMELAMCAESRSDPKASLAALSLAQSQEGAGAELARWHGEPALHRRLLLRKGNAAAMAGDRAGAEHTLDLALRATREASDGSMESMVHAARAVVYKQAGDTTSARGAAMSALEAAEAAGDARAVARRLYDIGKLSLALRETAVAREQFQRCLEISRGLAWEEGVAMAIAGLEEVAGGRKK